MANGSGWNSGQKLSLDRYRGLEFRKCYGAVHDFLRDEGQVRGGLARLEAATGGMDRARFRAYLGQEERRFGFAPDPGVIPKEESLLKASRFWGYLMRGQPLVDLGAGDAGGHGVLTHRVQWLLVGQWDEQARALKTPIVSLYRNLAAGNARVLSTAGAALVAGGGKIDTGRGRPFDSVWDEVVDSEAENATSPEQLFGYLQRHYAPLSDRMRWPQ